MKMHNGPGWPLHLRFEEYTALADGTFSRVDVVECGNGRHITQTLIRARNGTLLKVINWIDRTIAVA